MLISGNEPLLAILSQTKKYNCHPTGVVKTVYEILTLPLTAKMLFKMDLLSFHPLKTPLHNL